MHRDRVSGQSFAETCDRRRRASFELVVLLVLVACLGGHSALGYASPPDPPWLLGIYDGADYDDEIALLTDALAMGVPSRVVVEPRRPPVKATLFATGSVPTDVSLLSFHLRSPPIA